MKLTQNNVLMVIGIVVVVLIAGQRLFFSALPESVHMKTVKSEKDFRTILGDAGPKLLVFDMYADWCGPCRMLHPMLETLAERYVGKAEFYRVNVDANPGIAAYFGTTGIPHVVFVKDGKTVASLAGLNPSEAYESVINAEGLGKDAFGDK